MQCGGRMPRIAVYSTDGDDGCCGIGTRHCGVGDPLRARRGSDCRPSCSVNHRLHQRAAQLRVCVQYLAQSERRSRPAIRALETFRGHLANPVSCIHFAGLLSRNVEGRAQHCIAHSDPSARYRTDTFDAVGIASIGSIRSAADVHSDRRHRRAQRGQKSPGWSKAKAGYLRPFPCLARAKKLHRSLQLDHSHEEPRPKLHCKETPDVPRKNQCCILCDGRRQLATGCSGSCRAALAPLEDRALAREPPTALASPPQRPMRPLTWTKRVIER
jgi:hypothetical protein